MIIAPYRNGAGYRIRLIGSLVQWRFGLTERHLV